MPRLRNPPFQLGPSQVGLMLGPQNTARFELYFTWTVSGNLLSSSLPSSVPVSDLASRRKACSDEPFNAEAGTDHKSTLTNADWLLFANSGRPAPSLLAKALLSAFQARAPVRGKGPRTV